jgi:hypothetical protein
MTDETNVLQQFSKELYNGFFLIAQQFYDMGRDHEKAGKPHMNVAEEYVARKGLENNNGRDYKDNKRTSR